MPHSKQWRKLLLRELPDNPEALLIPGLPRVRRNYADPGFLDDFFEWLDQRIYENPQAGLRWAKVVPRLALMVPQDDGPGGRQAHCENVIKAHGILGGAYRATSQHDAAEAEFRTALGILESEVISPAVRADLLRRLSYLRISQGQPEKALDLLEEALRSYEKPCLGQSAALVRRGYALHDLGRFPEAVDCFGEALRGIDPDLSAAAERIHYAAIHNLAATTHNLADNSILEAWIALDYVRTAKPLAGNQPTMPVYSLHWVEGLIWAKLRACGVVVGFSLAERAVNALKRARQGFLHLRAPWEIVLVSLDLALLYRDLGRWDELLKLTIETLERFRILSGDTQVVVALGPIVIAAQMRKDVETAIAAAQKIIQTRAKRGSRGWRPPIRKRAGAPPKVSPNAPPGQRSRFAVLATRPILLKAAYEEIEDGFSVRRILKRAGITHKGAFYNAFKDREGCAKAVVDEHMRALVMDWLRRLGKADDPLDALASLLTEAPPIVASPAPEYRELLRERIKDVHQLWRSGLARNLARGQRQGTVRADFNPEEVAGYLITSSSGVARDACCERGFLWCLKALRPIGQHCRREPMSRRVISRASSRRCTRFTPTR